jgi:hypothetical protein
LVPGRTKVQRHRRWYYISVSKIDPTTARVCKWTADEVKKLKEVTLTHGAKY